MNEIRIAERITVDEPQNVERAILDLTGKKIDFEIIKKFITNEKNTIFYFDKKLNSSTAAGVYSDFAWLDTGFVDQMGHPIMIYMNNGYDGFVGHYTGTIRELAARAKQSHGKNARDIEQNYSRFVQKYVQRAEERTTSHIEDELTYSLEVVNRDAESQSSSVFATALKEAGVTMPVIKEEPEEEIIADVEEGMTAVQQEITMSLLFDQVESMQAYIDELLKRIENNERQSQTEIAVLKAQNDEYKQAMVNIRTFMQSDTGEVKEMMEGMGHRLLGRNQKILILGNTDIREDEMRAIAKDYFGFDKNDFEFVTDYSKIKNDGNRIHNCGRFAAVIFGNCPHKVAGMGNHTSIIDEFKQSQHCSVSVDARNKAGGLKITKQSFKDALMEVCRELKKAA